MRTTISFKVELECPVCHKNAEVIMPEKNTAHLNITAIIRTSVLEIAEERRCKWCGVLSQMPTHDEERFIEQASVLLTKEWIEAGFAQQPS